MNFLLFEQILSPYSLATPKNFFRMLSFFRLIYLWFSTVYDVTRRDTFTNLSDIWAKEIDLYSTNQECIKMLVGNKVDKVPLLVCRREFLPSQASSISQTQSYTLYWPGAFVSFESNWRYVMMLVNFQGMIHIHMNFFAGEWKGCQQKRGNWFCQGIWMSFHRMQCKDEG